jgi:hypothetical protein
MVAAGPPWWGPPPLIVPAVETDRLRVIFKDGAVSAIERIVK